MSSPGASDIIANGNRTIERVSNSNYCTLCREATPPGCWSASLAPKGSVESNPQWPHFYSLVVLQASPREATSVQDETRPDREHEELRGEGDPERLPTVKSLASVSRDGIERHPDQEHHRQARNETTHVDDARGGAMASQRVEAPSELEADEGTGPPSSEHDDEHADEPEGRRRGLCKHH